MKPQLTIVVVGSLPRAERAAALTQGLAAAGVSTDIVTADATHPAAACNAAAARAEGDFLLFTTATSHLQPAAIVALLAGMGLADACRFQPPGCIAPLTERFPAQGFIVRRMAFLEVGFAENPALLNLSALGLDFWRRFLAGGHTMATVTATALSRYPGEAFGDGQEEARAILAYPVCGYLDMPNPAHVLFFFALLSLALLTVSPSAVGIFAAVVATYAVVVTGLSAIQCPATPLMQAANYWRHFIAGVGRSWLCLVRGRPTVALRRYRVADGQITEEWPFVFAATWALWIAVALGLVLTLKLLV